MLPRWLRANRRTVWDSNPKCRGPGDLGGRLLENMTFDDLCEGQWASMVRLSPRVPVKAAAMAAAAAAAAAAESVGAMQQQQLQQPPGSLGTQVLAGRGDQEAHAVAATLPLPPAPAAPLPSALSK